MTPQAPRVTFYRFSLLLLCGLSGVLAFQGGCAIVGSSSGSNNATVSGGVAQVCIGCSAIAPETITQLKAQGITEDALNQFFLTIWAARKFHRKRSIMSCETLPRIISI
jgi:hypothetical protein